MEYLGTWKDKKGKKMKGLAVVPNDERVDSSSLFGPHLTSGFRWGSCVVIALNVYFNKRIDVIMGLTAQLDKEINFEGTTYKLFNIMSLHYKQQKKLQSYHSALRQNQGEDGYFKNVNQT